MKVILDTSVWVNTLRTGEAALRAPGRFDTHQLWMSAIVAGELLAGCRNLRERRGIEILIEPFRRSDRLIAPRTTDAIIAGKALSRLRARAIELRKPGAALLDALIAATCVGIGATLVSHNAADFERLASEMPLRFVPFERWAKGVL